MGLKISCDQHVLYFHTTDIRLTTCDTNDDRGSIPQELRANSPVIQDLPDQKGWRQTVNVVS